MSKQLDILCCIYSCCCVLYLRLLLFHLYKQVLCFISTAAIECLTYKQIFSVISKANVGLSNVKRFLRVITTTASIVCYT